MCVWGGGGDVVVVFVAVVGLLLVLLWWWWWCVCVCVCVCGFVVVVDVVELGKRGTLSLVVELRRYRNDLYSSSSSSCQFFLHLNIS